MHSCWHNDILQICISQWLSVRFTNVIQFKRIHKNQHFVQPQVHHVLSFSLFHSTVYGPSLCVLHIACKVTFLLFVSLINLKVKWKRCVTEIQRDLLLNSQIYGCMQQQRMICSNLFVSSAKFAYKNVILLHETEVPFRPTCLLDNNIRRLISWLKIPNMKD